MLSRRVLLAARTTRLCRSQQPLRLAQLPLMFQHVRSYADLMVTVPQMAESITEGTLSQIAKKVGDQVEQDEEIATIETDKVRSYRPRLSDWMGSRHGREGDFRF